MNITGLRRPFLAIATSCLAAGLAGCAQPEAVRQAGASAAASAAAAGLAVEGFRQRAQELSALRAVSADRLREANAAVALEIELRTRLWSRRGPKARLDAYAGFVADGDAIVDATARADAEATKARLDAIRGYVPVTSVSARLNDVAKSLGSLTADRDLEAEALFLKVFVEEVIAEIKKRREQADAADKQEK